VSKRPTFDPGTNALFWLNQAHHALRSAIIRGFKVNGADLTAEQWSVLEYLWFKKAAPQTAIAKATRRDKPAVTRLVVSLEEKGLVKRIRADMRTNIVQLTPKGEQLHEEYGPVLKGIVDDALGSISKKDMATVHQALKTLTTNLSKLGREDPEK
jgi:MarR family transcriptional regulator, organic hydroperoxide resistance regulator